MTKKHKIYDANGRFLRVAGESEIVQDGEVLRVEISAMDGLHLMQRLVVQDSLTPQTPRHSPGYVADSDHDGRAQRFFERKQQLADAWKQAPPLAVAADPVKPPAGHQPKLTGDADAAWERRNAALERAYLGGA